MTESIEEVEAMTEEEVRVVNSDELNLLSSSGVARLSPLGEGGLEAAAADTLLTTARELAAVDDIESAASTVFKACHQLLGTRQGFVTLLSVDRQRVEVVFVDTEGTTCSIEDETSHLGALPLQGMRRVVLEHKRPAWHNAVPRSPWAGLLPAGHPDLNNLLLAPVIADEEVVGFLGLANKDGGFDQGDGEQVAYLADLLSSVLKAARDHKALDRSETRVRQAEERLRLVFENIHSAVVLTNQRGEIVLANPPALELLDLDGSALGQSLSELISGADELLVDRPSRVRPQTRVITAAGTPRLIGFTTVAVRLPDGEGHLTVFQDIGAIKQTEARQRRAEQLAIVGEMAAKLSHEIKNPLSSLLAGLGLMELSTQDRPEEEEIVREMKSEVLRLRLIARDLLDAAKPSSLSPKHIEFPRFIQDTVAAYRAYCRSRDISLDLSLEVPLSTTVTVDANWFRRLAANLIINAAEATGQGGRITVGLRLLSTEQRQRWATRYPGDIVGLWVRDDGPGIPKETLERIFEPFYTTKSSGNGLGLSLALDVVESHGGVLLVSSRPGEGARFEIFLPVGPLKSCWHHRDLVPDSCQVCQGRTADETFFCWSAISDNEQSGSSRNHPCSGCGYFLRWNLSPYFDKQGGNLFLDPEDLDLMGEGVAGDS